MTTYVNTTDDALSIANDPDYLDHLAQCDDDDIARDVMESGE